MKSSVAPLSDTAKVENRLQEASAGEPRSYAVFQTPWHDKANLILPILFILLTFVELVVLKDVPFKMQMIIRYSVVSLLLMNMLHLAFTFMMLCSLPEMKQWMHESESGPFEFWTRAAFIFGGVFFFAGVMRQNIPVWPEHKELFLLVYFFAFEILGARHLYMQSQGLGILYSHFDQQENLKAPERTGHWLLRFFKNERQAYRGLYWSLILMVAFNCIYAKTDIDLFYVLGAISFTAAFPSIVALFLFNKGKKRKSVFLSRFLLWPFTGFFFFARAGTMAVHGTEYYFTFRQMVKNSKSTVKERKMWLWAILFFVPTLAACVVISVVSVPGWAYAKWSDAPVHWKLFFDLNTATFFTHYFIDYRLFSMRNPVSRKHIASLLGSVKGD